MPPASGCRRRCSRASTPWARWSTSPKTGHDYTWYVLNARIIEKEFGLSGQEQNPDLTGRSVRQVLARVRPGAPPPVQAFVDKESTS